MLQPCEIWIAETIELQHLMEQVTPNKSGKRLGKLTWAESGNVQPDVEDWIQTSKAAALPARRCPFISFFKVRVQRVLLGAGKVLTKAHPCGFSLSNNLQEFERPLWSRDGTLVFSSDRVYTAWSDSGMDEGAVWTGRRGVPGHIWKEIIRSVCFKLCEEPGGRSLA